MPIKSITLVIIDKISNSFDTLELTKVKVNSPGNMSKITMLFVKYLFATTEDVTCIEDRVIKEDENSIYIRATIKDLTVNNTVVGTILYTNRTIKYAISENDINNNCVKNIYVNTPFLNFYHIDNCNCIKHISIKSLKNIFIFKENVHSIKINDTVYYDLHRLRAFNTPIFDTSNVKYIGGMFNGCECLEEIDLKNLNIEKVKDIEHILDGCNNVAKVCLPTNNRTSNLQ